MGWDASSHERVRNGRKEIGILACGRDEGSPRQCPWMMDLVSGRRQRWRFQGKSRHTTYLGSRPHGGGSLHRTSNPVYDHNGIVIMGTQKCVPMSVAPETLFKVADSDWVSNHRLLIFCKMNSFILSAWFIIFWLIIFIWDNGKWVRCFWWIRNQ
jgi:hypothetical protein